MIATYDDYVAVTGDHVTSQADAEAALARAQRRAEELCERLFDAQERTEALTPDTDGVLWPSAYPVTAVPDGYRIDADALSVSTGATPSERDLFSDIWGIPLEALPGYVAPSPVPLTYTGGYAPGAAPQGLVDAICELASRYVAPADTRGVPAGVTSVTISGDASQSYSGRALGGSSGVPSSLRMQLRAYLHVQARSAD